MSKSGIAGFFRWSFRGLVLLLLVGGWLTTALALHVVVVPPKDGMPSMSEERGWLDWRLVVVPKNRLGLSDTYNDARDWTASDLIDHEAVVVRMTETGKGEMLNHVGENTIRQEIEKQTDGVVSPIRQQLQDEAAPTTETSTPVAPASEPQP